jgi:hypothetical protein
MQKLGKDIKCQVCGTIFYCPKAQLHKRKYCSFKCYWADRGRLYSGKNNYFYGKHHSQETKDKISKNRKGKCCGKNNPLYGKKLSQKTILTQPSKEDT